MALSARQRAIRSSGNVAALIGAPPVNVTAPSISGSAQVGSVLTRVNGTWLGLGITYAHQWLANGVPIAGQTGSTYTPVAGDVGKVIAIRTVATNTSGSATATSAATAAVQSASPSAPGPITAAPTAGTVTSSSVALTWIAPSSGGSPTDYLVQYKLTSDTSWTTIDLASTALGGTITGLSTSMSYDFRVAASNAGGLGAYSPALTVSTAAAAPVAPGTISAAPTAGAITPSSVALSWLAPSSGGTPTDYLVQVRVTGAGSWTTLDEGSTALSGNVTGLAASTSYDFRVAASNSAGTGAYSPALTVSTGAAAANSNVGSLVLDLQSAFH